MLGKLMKYEIKSMARILLPLYAVLLIVAGAFALNMKLTMNSNVITLLERVAILTSFLFAGAILAVFVVTVILVIQRFYRNLLGSEGYLMFTLPVQTWMHIVSKALTALLFIVTGIGAGILSGLIIVSILSRVPDFLQALKEGWEMLSNGRPVAKTVLMMIVVLLTGTMQSILKVYASIAAGHQLSGHRVLGSILGYAAFSILETMLLNTGMVRYIRTRAGMAGPSFWGAVGICCVGIIIYGLITWYLLDRRLNLE